MFANMLANLVAKFMSSVAFKNVEYLLQFVIANKHFLVICKLKNCQRGTVVSCVAPLERSHLIG